MKKKRFSLIVTFATLLALAPTLRSQAVYTATRSSRLEAGAGVSLISPDYVDKNVYGGSVWADYDLGKWWGLEAAAHLSAITPDDWAENSFGIGARGLYHYRKYIGYVKLMAGLAKLSPQDYRVTALKQQSISSPYFALGGGVEYRVSSKINVRGDFELQQWTNFEPHTLSPLVVTIGASYIIK